MTTVNDKVTKKVTETLNELGFILYDINYVKNGKNWFLQIAIDREAGSVDLNDCTLASEHLSEVLDNITPDPFPDAYYLEVSSPGAEREIKNDHQLSQVLNEYIHLDFKNPTAGLDFVEGTLESFDEQYIHLIVKNKTRRINQSFDRDNIKYMRLAIEF